MEVEKFLGSFDFKIARIFKEKNQFGERTSKDIQVCKNSVLILLM